MDGKFADPEKVTEATNIYILGLQKAEEEKRISTLVIAMEKSNKTVTRWTIAMGIMTSVIVIMTGIMLWIAFHPVPIQVNIS